MKTRYIRRSPLVYAKQFFFSNPAKSYKFLLYIFYFLLRKRPALKLSVLQGKKMLLDLSSHIDRTIFFHEQAVRKLSDFLRFHLKKNSVFFDIGANSGYFSLMASVLSPQGMVHAFEPVPKTSRMLEESVMINGMKNIIVNNVCVGKKNGSGKLFLASNSDVSSLRKTEFQEKTEEIQCKIVTLENYCRMKHVTAIDILKIDVEGCEYEILKHSISLLRRYKTLLIVEFSNITAQSFGYHPNQMYDFLTEHGYRIYAYKKHKLVFQKKKNFYNEDLFCVYKALNV